MSRKDGWKLSACGDKMQYRNWQEADKRMRGKHGKSRGMSVYHCKFCRWFHFGRAPGFNGKSG